MKQIGGRQIWAVTDITGAVARHFEKMEIPQLSVEGEITNLRPPSGSQLFFTLSDDHEIRCAMKTVAWDRLRSKPRDGDRVIVRGDLQYWPQRNSITFWAVMIEPAGRGVLLAEIERLRGRLRDDGLIPGRARPIPRVPRRIGLVTSRGAAAYADAMRVMHERWPAVDVLHCDAPVQGETAPEAIVQALDAADRAPGVEVILLLRGGGSLEDLMAFNDERVCRAVAACDTPVVTGVGHERDGVLADEVADLRCPTPTAAAAAVTPDARELLAGLGELDRRLAASLARARTEARSRLENVHGDLVRLLREQGVRGRLAVAARENRLGNALARPVLQARERVSGNARRLPTSLSRRAERAAAERRALAGRLAASVSRIDAAARARVGRAEGMLTALSPRATLSRGYAIVRDEAGRIRPDGGQLDPGVRLELEFRDARVATRVEETS